VSGIAPDDPVVDELLDGQAVDKFGVHMRLPVTARELYD
jgi:hypothetical protein